MFSFLHDSISQTFSAEKSADRTLSSDTDRSPFIPISAAAATTDAERVPAGGGQVQGGRHCHRGGGRAALRGSAADAAEQAARVRQSEQTEDGVQFFG